MSNVSLQIQLNPTLDTNALKQLFAQLQQALNSGDSNFSPVDAKKIQQELANATKSVELFEKQFDGTKAQVAKVNEELAKSPKIAENFNKAFQFNQIKQAFDTLSQTVGGLSAPFRELDNVTQQMKTLGGSATALAEPLRDVAVVMSKELPFAAAELQQTMFDAIASGVQGGAKELQTFADTAAKLATGGGSDIASATNLIAGQLNAYGKSAEDAAKFSDIFFNTVNLGVTSIPELSSTLANVVPTASSLGIELEAVGASLAVMTSKGIPTAQSTTKLNALLIELAKPGAALAPILQKAGVSLESLNQEDLPVTLSKINTALKESGKASIEVFSSSEAGAAFATLAGDVEGFAKTFEEVRDTTGSAQFAYEQMASSIDVQTTQIQKQIEALVIEGFDLLGGGITTVLSTASQLAPTLTSLGALSSIIPEGAVGNLKTFAVTLLNSVVPGLIATNATTGALAINTNALSAANLAGAAKTKIFAAAQMLSNAVMGANPIGAVVLALVGLGTVLVIAYNQSETFRKGIDSAFTFIREKAEELLKYLKAFGAGISAVFKGENPLKAMSESVETSDLEQKLEKSLETIEEGTLKDLKFKADIEKNDNFDRKIKDLEETEAKIKVITESDNRTPEQEKELERLTAKSQNLANAIGGVAKNAVTETKGAIDANGKYTEQLTINVEKAKEFAKAQKEGLSKDLVKNQTDVSNALIKQNDVYEEQKKKLDQMAKKAVELKNAGKNEEYEKQVKDMEEFGKEVDKNKTKLVDNFTKAVQGGTANDKAQKDVGKTLGLNNEQIKAMAVNQKDVTAEVGKTGEAAKSLADQFDETLNAQKKQFDQGIKEESQLRLQLRTRKDLSKEEKEQLQSKLKDTIKLNNESNKQLKTTEQAEKDAKKRFEEKKAVEKKSAIELFNREKDALNAEFERLQIEKERQLAIEGRSKNVFDELQNEKDKKTLYENQLEILKKQFAVGADGSIGLKLDKEKLDKAKEDYDKALKDITNNISRSEIASIQINSKISNESLDETKKDLAQAVKDTEYNISIGLANSFDLLASVSNQLNLVEELIRRKSEELKQVQLLPDADSSKLARTEALNKDLENLQLESLEFNRKISALNKQNSIAMLNFELEEANKREDIRKKEVDRQKEFYETLINNSRDNSLAFFADEKERELSRLEDIFKRQEELEKGRTESTKKQFDALAGAYNKGRLSEEAYYRQSAELSAQNTINEQEELKRKQSFEEEKIRIAEKAKLKELIAKSVANGQLLELERNRQVQELNAQQKRLEQERKIKEQSGDVEGVRKIQEELNKVGESITEKGDVISEYTKLIQGDITENLTNLFNGDAEQAKEGFKEVFAVIAGALKAQAGATATSFVLGQLGIQAGATGLVGLLAVPAITALVNAAIGKLLDPILNGLLSFSTGGRVDSPTMAIIGDASKSRAGADTEWVFRDDQINVLLYRVANEFNKSLFNLVDNLREDNNYLVTLLQENLELSKFAVDSNGNIVDSQSDVMVLALATALNTNVKELDNKFNTLTAYQTKLNEQTQDSNIDYNVFREEFSILKSELLNKGTNSKVSNDLLKVVNVINNDNVIATIDNMRNDIVAEIQTTNQKLDILTNTVSNLQLSISQNDIYKANRTVEINRLSRART